jgi:hypothetical protein
VASSFAVAELRATTLMAIHKRKAQIVVANGAFILIAAAYLANGVDINDPLNSERVLPRLMITTVDKAGEPHERRSLLH